MAKLQIIQGLVVLTIATLVAADITIDITTPGPGRRRRSAGVQGIPSDCPTLIEVDKRDGSGDIDFYTCVANGKVCTSRDVDPCSSLKVDCESFKSPADEAFKEMFPKAYAKVCVESLTDEQCLYTDIEYETCAEAKAKTMDENEICITLSNGEEECSEIPLKYLTLVRMQNAHNRRARINELPQYRPN